MTVDPAIIDALYAIGLGLLVGFEREHHDLSEELAARSPSAPGGVEAGPPPEPTTPIEVLLGARTFALLGLVGWLLAYLGADHPPLLAVGVAVTGIFLMVQYVVGRRAHGGGLTTEVAAVVVLLLGVLVRFDRALAVALALATTLLLVSKPWMQVAVRRLRRIEITATIQLLVLIAIVLPMLPTEAVDPWHALPPRTIGIFIVLIAAIGYVGYLATRTLGVNRGAGLTGLLGGIASSTATTIAMARLARRSPAMTTPAQVGALLANTMMAVRVLVVSMVLSPALGWRVAPALGGMAVVLLVGAGLRYRAHRRAGVAVEAVDTADALRNPFALLPALKWGAILCVILLIAEAGRRLFGASGLLAAAGLAGLADVDAIVLAASREASRGAIDVEFAALAIAIAVVSNTVAKGVLAWLGGGRRFAAPVVVVLAAAALAAIATALVVAAVGS